MWDPRKAIRIEEKRETYDYPDLIRRLADCEGGIAWGDWGVFETDLKHIRYLLSQYPYLIQEIGRSEMSRGLVQLTEEGIELAKKVTLVEELLQECRGAFSVLMKYVDGAAESQAIIQENEKESASY